MSDGLREVLGVVVTLGVRLIDPVSVELRVSLLVRDPEAVSELLAVLVSLAVADALGVTVKLDVELWD